MSKDKPHLLLLGGIAGAIGSGLCCVGPLVLVLLGIGGSWAGTLTALDPYRPAFIAFAIITLLWAGWKVYRPITKCPEGSVCAIPENRTIYQRLFWVAVVIAVILITSPYWIVWLMT